MRISILTFVRSSSTSKRQRGYVVNVDYVRAIKLKRITDIRNNNGRNTEEKTLITSEYLSDGGNNGIQGICIRSIRFNRAGNVQVVDDCDGSHTYSHDITRDGILMP